jgi:two-component system nitrogen regulation sensor histidine kinase GlnL
MNRLLTPNRCRESESVNIHEVLERVRTLLLAEFPERLDRARLRHQPAGALGDKEQLIQAILNVARNAAQATGGRRDPLHHAHRARVTIARPPTASRRRRDRGRRPGVPPRSPSDLLSW